MYMYPVKGSLCLKLATSKVRSQPALRHSTVTVSASHSVDLENMFDSDLYK